MFNLPNSRNFTIISNTTEFERAKNYELCNYIIHEKGNYIYVYRRSGFKWEKDTYVFFSNKKKEEINITGLQSYQYFYKYCGKEEVEKMKKVLRPIEMWESYEQMHYFNGEYANELISKDIYAFDCNSSFTYGAMNLSEDFEKLKEYLFLLYKEKEKAKTPLKRGYFKNLQNYLIGYFSRIKQFIAVRSEIIRLSNANIYDKMAKIIDKGGHVYLSNTDSIVTDSIGAEVMEKYLSTEVGGFKLETQAKELYYKSSNAYQIGDKLVYSGVSFFARKHTDLIKGVYAEQKGELVKGFDFFIDSERGIKICQICGSEINVTEYNKLGEVLGVYTYKIKE